MKAIDRAEERMRTRLEIAKRLRAIVDEYPDEALVVIRSWLRDTRPSDQERELIETIVGARYEART